MALTISEASAVNTVIDHLAGRSTSAGEPIATRTATIDALSLLAGSAFKALKAGYTGFETGRFSAREVLTDRWRIAPSEVWMVELHGVELLPFATEQLARHHVLTEGSWPSDADLDWRTGSLPRSKVLYVNGRHTLCSIWPKTIRTGTAPTTDSPDESVTACKVCGCTEDEPCDGGCAWVTGDDNTLEVDLCTACAWTIARDAVKSGLYKAFLRMPSDVAAAVQIGDLDLGGTDNGKVCGPIRGVVEDVADVRERMLMAEALRPRADDMMILGLPPAQYMPGERLVPFLRFCRAVWEECDRQWAKWGDQQHPDGTGGQRWRDVRNRVQNETDSAAPLGRVTWLDIAREELFEAFAEDGLRALSGELVQSASVIATWLFDLGRRSGWPLPAIAADGQVQDVAIADQAVDPC